MIIWDGAQQVNVVATVNTPGLRFMPKFDGSYVQWAAPSAITTLDWAYEGAATIEVSESAVILNVPDGAANKTLTINQNDVTNNSIGVSIVNAGTGAGLLLDQNGIGIALDIDSESTTADIVNVSAAALTTGMAVDISDANALTTGRLLNLASDSADASARTC